MRLTVRVPATTANLGPGFDVLGLALARWNQATFTLGETPAPWEAHNQGEGATHLPRDAEHLTLRAFRRLYEHLGAPLPGKVYLETQNSIPVGSGLGSSAAAVVAGVVAANATLGNPLSRQALLALASEMEGHPDNAAPALFGGLTAAWLAADGAAQACRLPLAPTWQERPWLAVAVPEVQLSTAQARRALPQTVPFHDAVFNLSRLALLLDALRRGDPQLLAEAAQDRLHQPYRWALLPAAEAVRRAAQRAGACAVVLSGAGPGVLALVPEGDAEAVAQAMVQAWAEAGVAARGWALRPAMQGAQVVHHTA